MGRHRCEIFLGFLLPKVTLSWVSESYSQNIVQILTWKVFFMENSVIYENIDRFSQNGGNRCGSVPAAGSFQQLALLIK